MEISAIVEADLKLISHLYTSIFSNPPWNEHWEYSWAYQRLNWVYQAQGFIGFVAKNNQKIVGAILGKFVPFQGKQGFEIVEFFVDAQYQNSGVGTQLLSKLKSELKHNKYKFIILLTSKNTNAEAFYLKRNYQRDDKLVLLRQEI